MTRSLLFACGFLIAATAAAHADALPGSPAAVIAGELDTTLTSRGMTTPHQVELDNPLLSLPPGVTAQSLRIADLSVDERSGRFTADLVPPDSHLHLRIGGHVYQMIQVAVPDRPIAPGEVITSADLRTATVRLDPSRQYPLADASAFLYKTPRHLLQPDLPVYPADLQVPIVIHRGDLVLMKVSTPLMEVTTQGKALQDAARGALIQVSNTKSKRVVEGVVVGPGAVAIASPLER
jgi:flagella basal body P-ring formation protein FlgA